MKENKEMEFKAEISRTFIKTVSAYANYGMGKIIFGISDSGEIKGIQNINEACIEIENMVNDSVKPTPEFSLQIDNKNRLITLTVFEGSFKPYLYKGKAYKRSDTSTVEVDQLEFKRLILMGENRYFEELKASKQNLSFKFFFSELKKQIHVENLGKDTLITLGLYEKNSGYNNAAALLSDSNNFPGVDIIRFGSTINEIFHRETISKVSIIEQLLKTEEIFDRFYKVEKIIGMKRIEDYLIPKDAFRETVANALVHRTWDINANIRIAMYQDKIEVFSPGGLPHGLSKEEYLKGYISVQRNPLLAVVFFRLKIIEMFGTGIKRIKESYVNIKNKPNFEVSENSIVITLPSKEKRSKLTTDEQKIMDVFSEGRVLSRREISESSSFGKDKVLRIIDELIEKKYIVKVGVGRGTKYRIQ